MIQSKARPYVDIHSHQFDRQEGVIRIVNHFYQDYLDEGLPEYPISLGLHPWHTGAPGFDQAVFVKASKVNNVVAIGEIGLDKLTNSSLEDQTQLFIDQARIADRMGLPVIIHAVKTFDEFLRMKKTMKPVSPWIIHGFRGNATLANQLISAGFYLSFGAALLNAGVKLRKALQSIPKSHLFLETDESEVPISEIYQKASDILEISTSELTYFVYQNFQSIFEKYVDTELARTN